MLNFTVVSPADRATAAEIRLADAAGQNAYGQGRGRAPALDETIRSLVADAAVGEPRTVEIMGAFTQGFDAAADRAARALLSP